MLEKTKKLVEEKSFNTASGRYYCNSVMSLSEVDRDYNGVSIPQAVGTIAICVRKD